MVMALLAVVIGLVLIRLTLPLWIFAWLVLVEVINAPKQPRKPDPDSWLNTWHW